MFTFRLAITVALSVCAAQARAQTVKVGIIDTYSGPLAAAGEQIDRGIRLYMSQHEKDLPPSVTIELIRRDDTGPNPEVAKRLAQELIARDKVNFLAGVIWTPNALAIAPLATEAKVPFVIMNAATSMITTKSPYIVRTSFSTWQSSVPLGNWAAKHGIRTVYTLVSDYAPGIDYENGFTKSYTEAGGTIIGGARMPVPVFDFVPFLQRAKDAKPNAVFAFVPDPPEAAALMKAFNDLGLKDAGISLIGPGVLTTEEELPAMGDAAIGTITVFHYGTAGVRPANTAFTAAYTAAFGAREEATFQAVAAYDGMAAIFHVVTEQKGMIDPDKTMALLKGWKYDSARGPIMIDPETRDIVQNEYLRRVDKIDGRLRNTEIETFPMVRDPWKELNKAK
jgi:branched-chain amino acid transport system substrate-binding protein